MTLQAPVPRFPPLVNSERTLRRFIEASRHPATRDIDAVSRADEADAAVTALVNSASCRPVRTEYLPTGWNVKWAEGRLRKAHRRTVRLLKEANPTAPEWELKRAATDMLFGIIDSPHWRMMVEGGPAD